MCVFFGWGLLGPTIMTRNVNNLFIEFLGALGALVPGDEIGGRLESSRNGSIAVMVIGFHSGSDFKLRRTLAEIKQNWRI